MQSALKSSIENTEIYNDVIRGLDKNQKSLPSKYFYDKRGSDLFERICNLDEYYLTRTELQIMEDRVAEMARFMDDPIQLVEPGSGSSLKTRMLLRTLPKLHSYIPVDISEQYLTEIAGNLRKEFPELSIEPVAADYTKPFKIPSTSADIRTVAYFPGSTIGNFNKENAKRFLSQLSELIGSDGGLLIGYDLLKEEDVLFAAYDDSEGVTAEFNLNILTHINRVLDANFDLSQYRHLARFNKEKSRMEMHLESLKDQQIVIGKEAFYIRKGETIHTENSHKYTLHTFRELTEGSFDVVHTWMDDKKYFCVQYLEKSGR